MSSWLLPRRRLREQSKCSASDLVRSVCLQRSQKKVSDLRDLCSGYAETQAFKQRRPTGSVVEHRGQSPARPPYWGSFCEYMYMAHGRIVFVQLISALPLGNGQEIEKVRSKSAHFPHSQEVECTHRTSLLRRLLECLRWQSSRPGSEVDNKVYLQV